MLKKVLVVLALIVVAFVIVVSMRPDEMTVTRTTVLPAKPDVVFNHVDDLHLWQQWSPWAKLDPNSKVGFEGPGAGVGAKFSWAGNSEVGEGNMTITESKPNYSVRIALVFVKPMPGTADTHFTLQPEADGTRLTWSMTAQQNFIGKAVGLVLNCDKMCGDQFERGFANLKTVLAGAAAK